MQGFNMGRYHAPSSLDPSLAAPTKKRKLTTTNSTPKAPPTIRFEMPFAIWCNTCPSSSTSCLIGQGVRFNAQKTKVGNYFSTPIWQFRMKHTACGGWIEIRTDPKSSEYVVSEGARKRDTGSDEVVAERIGGVLVGDEAEKERRRQDAFAAFEGKKEDKDRARGEAKRLEALQSLKQRDWGDVDAANSKLRSTFRVGRKAREKDTAGVEKLKDTMGLGIEFVEEDEGDKRRAGFVEFGTVGDAVDGASAVSKPLFTLNANPSRDKRDASKLKVHDLQRQLAVNTRAALDPFDSSSIDTVPSQTVLGLKRKTSAMKGQPSGMGSNGLTSLDEIGSSIGDDGDHLKPTQPGILVDYDSD